MTFPWIEFTVSVVITRTDFTIFELVDNYTELTDSVDKTVKQKPYVKGKYSIVGGKVYKYVQ